MGARARGLTLEPTPLLHIGAAVRLTCEGRTVDGVVVVASGNGASLVIEFEALLAGWAGYMPVLWTAAGWEAMNGVPIALASADP